MARKETIKDDVDIDYDSFDDFDSFDDSDDMSGDDASSGSSRKVSNKIRSTLAQSVEQKYRDAQFRRELLKGSLPSDYSYVLEDYDTISKEVGSLYRDQQKEWEKHRSGIKKLIKPYADVIGSLGFKKLQGWAEEEDRQRTGSPSDEEVDELRIQSILSETFGQLQEEQTQQLTQLETARQEREDERYAGDQAEKEVAAKRGIEGNQYLAGINKNIGVLTNYNNKINFPYQKRSLEMQARLLVTAQRSLSSLNNFREMALRELQDIHKNTALPDYLKINSQEIITKSLKENMANKISAPFTGVGSKVAQRVFGKVREKMTDWWATIGEMVESGNMANETFSDDMDGDGSAWSGLKSMLGGVLSDQLVNRPANFIKNKITPKIRDYLEKNHKVSLHGSSLKSMGSQFGALFNEALQKGETGNKLLDSLIDLFELQGAAETGNRTVWDKSRLELEKAAFMDNRFKLSVTDVIPQWLKKIYGEVYGINNNKEAPDLTWDFNKEKFVTQKEMNAEVMDKLIDKERIKKHKEGVARWIEILGDGASFSKKTYGFLEKWVIDGLRGSKALSPMHLLSDTLDAPKDVKEELELVLSARFNLNQKQLDLVKSGTMNDILKATRLGSATFHNAMTRSADAASDIRPTAMLADPKIIDALSQTPEGRRALKDYGAVSSDGHGGMQYNWKFEDQFLDQHELRRVRERRVGGKIVKDSKGYRRNRKVAYDENGKPYLTDDRYSDRLDSEGYDDMEVVRKEGAKSLFGFDDFHYDQNQKEEQRILNSLRDFPNPHLHPGYGREFFFDPDGKIITAGNKNFLRLRARLDPALDRRIKTGYASGGKIPSFAKGGNTAKALQSGPTKGGVDQASLVKTHGGEFVVNNEATKTNEKLLEMINTHGAPFLNADKTINSVYHKLLGFKSANDFDAWGATKSLTSKSVKEADKQKNLMITNLIKTLDPKLHSVADMKFIVDAKQPAGKRYIKILKMWEDQQIKLMKQNPLQYAKGWGKRGIDFTNGKIDAWLDKNDPTGNNKALKQKLGEGFSSTLRGLGDIGGDIKNKIMGKYDRQKLAAKSILLDRDNTLNMVKEQIAADTKGKLNYYSKVKDIYIEGRKSPVIKRLSWIDPGYYDKQSGKRLKTPADITGTIIDSRGNVVLSVDQLLFDKFYTVENGINIPFKFLGMEDSNRKFLTTGEFTDNLSKELMSSEKFKKLAAKYKGYKDTAMKFLKDDAVDCYLRGDMTTPILRARILKQGGYIDKNTGNTLWTHHDITGDVVDRNNELVLSSEQLADGLFDAEGKHLKISKLKQIRNMAFMRGSEVYNKYAAKHVTRFKDKSLNMMSNMGEKAVGLNFDDKPVDVYVKGDSRPRITAAMFKSGSMIDVKSGKPIKSHSGIAGPVVSKIDESGNQLITEDDIKTGLVDAFGEELYLPKMQTSLNRFTNYLKEAVLPKSKLGGLRNYFTMSPAKRMAELNKTLNRLKIAYDVYVVGDPVNPRLTKVGFESSKYISAKSGLAITLPEFIDGPVKDLEGNIILTEEELAKGLLTRDGKKIRTDVNGGGLLNKIVGTASIMKRAGGKRDELMRTLGLSSIKTEAKEEAKASQVRTYTIKFKHKKGQPLSPEQARINNTTFTDTDIRDGKLVKNEFDENGGVTVEIVDCVENIDKSTWLKYASSNKIGDGVSFQNVFTLGGFIIDDLGKVIKTTYHTGKVKKAKVPAIPSVKGLIGSTVDKLKNRLGSWQRQRADKDKSKGDDKDKPEKPKEKKHSWITKLVKKFMLPLGVMVGGITSGIGAMKASLLGGLAWLGQSIVRNRIISSLGGFMGKSGLGRALTVGTMAYGGMKAYNYLDGDGSGPSSYINDVNQANAHLDPTSKVLNMSDAVRAKEGATHKGMLESALENPATAAILTAAASMLPGNFKTIGKGALKWGGKGLKGLWNVGGKLGGAAGRGLGHTADATGKVLSKAVPKTAGAVGKVARGLGTAWRMTGGGAGLAIRGLGMMAGLSSLIVPAALVIGAGAAIWYGSKFIMNTWNNGKNPWNRFRMAQYGFDHNDKELKEKIAKIESIATKLVTINGKNQPMVKTDDKATIEILKVCGLYDEKGNPIEEQKERIPSFSVWFKERFLRVFASYLVALKRIRGKAEMIDLSTLNRKEQISLAEEVHFKSLTDSPYVITHSPFEKPTETKVDATQVDVIYRKLMSKIKTSPDIKDGELKDFNKTSEGDNAKDGLDDKVSKPLPPNATPEQKLAAEMDKQLDKKVDKPFDAKTMVDKANEAVKYQTEASKLITKTHNAQIRAATDKATEETQKQFDTNTKTLTEKFKDFMSSMGNSISNGWDQTKEAIGLTNNQASESNGGGFFGAIGDVINKGAGAISGKTKEIQLGVYKAFRNAGLSDAQAKIITAEVGRENDYLSKYVFGSHSDPANGKFNLGMLSWQGDRGKKLYELLASNGLIKGNKMVEDQKTLNAQAAFAVNEIRTNSSYKPTLEKFLNNPNVDYKTGAQILGTNFIRWRYNDSAYASHHKRRDDYYKQIQTNVGGSGDALVNAATGGGGSMSGGGASASTGGTTNSPPALLSMAQMGKPLANSNITVPSLTSPTSGNSGASAAVAQPKGNKLTSSDQSAGVDWDFDKIADTAIKNNLGKSKGKCAEYVRRALQAGDLKGKIKGGLGDAYQYLSNLPKLGFNRVFSGKTLDGFKPLKGDIAVFDRKVYGQDKPNSGGWVYGHVCLWTGGNWVSDFVQPTVYPHSKYGSSGGIPFTIFRGNGVSKKSGIQCLPGYDDDEQPFKPTNATAEQTPQPVTATNSTVSNVQRVNDTINKVNDNGVSTSAVPVSNPVQPDPLANAQANGEMVNLLTKQLTVQEQILGVLKQMASSGMGSTQSQQAVTKPDLKALNNLPRNEQSAFAGIAPPVSVLKPS